MGANPAVSLLLALVCARLCWAASHCKPLVEQAFSVVRKLQFHLQAWGVGREENVTPHTAAGLRLTASTHSTGAGASKQGRR